MNKIGWELRKFHREEYSAHRGVRYNFYPVKDIFLSGLKGVKKEHRRLFDADPANLNEICEAFKRFDDAVLKKRGHAL